MAKLVYGLNQSLDGYVDHMKPGPPAPAALPSLVELVRGLTGSIYGRRMYETMRYWDEDLPDWDAEDRDFAVAWRSQPKWVVSRSLKSVGPNATLVADDFETVIRRLKAELAGEIQVAGPVLAQSLTEAGLIDEYRLYLRPVVLGSGSPFFAGPRPPPRAENAPQEVGWKRAEIVSVCGSAGHNPHTRRTAALSLPIMRSI
jgi:dihydrofolate reductase